MGDGTVSMQMAVVPMQTRMAGWFDPGLPPKQGCPKPWRVPSMGILSGNSCKTTKQGPRHHQPGSPERADPVVVARSRHLGLIAGPATRGGRRPR
jgi:hypothetical protein